jgi:hypothetical protein
MKRRALIVLTLCFLTLGLATGLVLALSEAEPNDTPAEANELPAVQVMGGTIDPAGDQDYYALDGVNTSWGFIALLQTDNSTDSQDGTLTALGSDGSTVLQEDTGSWEHGSGIALQNYADGPSEHYLRVNEDGDDATVTTYTLRLFQTVVSTQPETEPNDSRASGTPSSFTMEGVLSTPGDRDCFAFQGEAGDTILLAVDGDPENDGSLANPVLELVDPSDSVLATANVTGLGGKEFLEYDSLTADGVYAYCISSTTGGPGATYRAGIVSNGGLYRVDFEVGPTWLNRPTDGNASVSDTLSFRLAITNTSPLTVPGDINHSGRFDPSCLNYVTATPAPTNVESDLIEWTGLKTDLAPGKAYSVTVEMQAIDHCFDTMHQGTFVTHFFTGFGADAPYRIARTHYVPLLRISK